jgi:hypothetical protein
MNANNPVLISDRNLSHAWGKSFLHLMNHPLSHVPSMVICINGFENGEPIEDGPIRTAVDKQLALDSKYSTAVTAMMIFPYLSWLRKGRPPRAVFFEYAIKRLLPRLKARSQLNRRGTYFERMMAFEGIKGGKAFEINQLDFVITQMAKGQADNRHPRKSGLQISCIDPAKDHTGSSRQGFPCLQQVGFEYDPVVGLSLTAFYPSQFIFDRAYGNYLGLCNLAAFVAHELQLNIARVTMFVAHPQLGAGLAKGRLRTLADIVDRSLATAGAAG